MSAWNDKRVNSIDPNADYDADVSHDGGRTWEISNRGTNCGEMVQIEMVGEIKAGRSFNQNGPVVTIAEDEGKHTRWTPRA